MSPLRQIPPSIRERLWDGDVLRILFAGDLGFDVWVEKFANPPQIFFEGLALPIERFDHVVERVDEYLAEPDVTFLWNGKIPSKRDKAL
jgi:hypothetical protein